MFCLCIQGYLISQQGCRWFKIKLKLYNALNVEEYVKNPDRKIVTRDGRNVRILCTDRASVTCPVVALVQENDSENVHNYTENGYWLGHTQNSNDLFFAPIKKEGWVSIFKDPSEDIQLGKVYTSKEIAEDMAKKCALSPNYLTTIKIEWEEWYEDT